eukprot:8697878-Pyramimonas_sp.AAC.1
MVVMERSSFNEVDENAMTEAALQHMARGVHKGGTDGHGGGGETSRAEERASVQFAHEAWRDHFAAMGTNLLNDQDNGR